MGGSVRDLLLNRKPKDFDIATNAHPEQIRDLFRNCILIGRRFRLAHIRFGREIVEVATFRSSQETEHEDHARTEHGLIIRDNVYGTISEDALRRDFTINALYYNIADYSVVDYCDGMADLQQHTLRLIGNPEKRYVEDPVRLLRAVRLAGKLGLKIAPETAAPLAKNHGLLAHISPARLFDETLKILMSGACVKIVHMLRHYGLFKQLFPQTDKMLHAENHKNILHFIETALQNTDSRLAESKHVTPIFLLSALLWYPFLQLLHTHQKIDPIVIEKTAEKVISLQIKSTAIPRRITTGIKEIWSLQFRFEKPQPRNIHRLIIHQRFRAAYDFLLLRVVADASLADLAKWWTDYIAADAATREEMVKLKHTAPKKRRKRSKKKKVNQNTIAPPTV